MKLDDLLFPGFYIFNGLLLISVNYFYKATCKKAISFVVPKELILIWILSGTGAVLIKKMSNKYRGHKNKVIFFNQENWRYDCYVYLKQQLWQQYVELFK